MSTSIIPQDNNKSNSYDPHLPVELIYFEAYTYQDSIVLKWGTATETGNFGFNVQRLNANSSWSTLGFVEGNGNSNSPKHYSFTDTNVVVNQLYIYRLIQIDIVGTIDSSDTINVKIVTSVEKLSNNQNAYKLTPNYPNPFNPVTNIRFTIPKASNVNISVYNSAGEKVAEVIDKYMAAGEYELNFNADGLSSGAYFYKLTAGDFTQIRKMLLIK